MAKYTASKRKSLRPSQFGVPSKAKTPAARAKPGNYPMGDKKHAALAKAFASMHNSPNKAAIDRKADAVLGKSKSPAKKRGRK